MRQKRYLETARAARAAREAKWLCKNQENEEAEEESNWDDLVLQFVQSIPDDFIDKVPNCSFKLKEVLKLTNQQAICIANKKTITQSKIFLSQHCPTVIIEDLPEEVIVDDFLKKWLWEICLM
ncbi:hypothetical protein HK096_000737, partial [Nowakowskiella sp. JEL0078]